MKNVINLITILGISIAKTSRIYKSYQKFVTVF